MVGHLFYICMGILAPGLMRLGKKIKLVLELRLVALKACKGNAFSSYSIIRYSDAWSYKPH